MRTYGRQGQINGVGGTWVEVSTDANGFNDQIWFTTLIQTLKLALGESPFFGNYGIPAQQSVITQVFPDFYAMQTQQNFAAYFSSLTLTPVPGTAAPFYNAQATFHPGAILPTEVAT